MNEPMNEPIATRASGPGEARNAKRWWRGFLVLLLLSVLAELAVSLHPHFAIEALPGFHAAYAFLACGVMILMARVFGLLLRRSQAYYKAADE